MTSLMLSPLRRLVSLLSLLVWFIIAAAAPVSGGSSPDVAAEAERFFQDPSFLEVKASPTGDYLAIRTHNRGRRSLLPYNLRDGERMTGATVDAGHNISRFVWIDEHTIVYTITKWDYYYVGINRLKVNDRQRPEAMVFLRQAGLLVRDIVHPMPQVPNRFLATLAVSGQATPPDLYWVDFENRTTQRVARNPGLIYDWIVDSNGNLLGGLENPSGRIYFRPYDAESGAFAEAPMELDRNSFPLGVSATGTHFLMTQHNDQGYMEVVPWHIAANRPVGRPF